MAKKSPLRQRRIRITPAITASNLGSDGVINLNVDVWRGKLRPSVFIAGPIACESGSVAQPLLRCPCTYHAFYGRLETVDEIEHCQLGKPGQTLETAPMIGSMRWEVQSHFDVTLGPMEQDKSQHFIPQGKFYSEIWGRIREYVGPGLDFTIHLSIRSHNSLPIPLGEGQLGLDICLGRRDPSQLRQVCLPTYTA